MKEEKFPHTRKALHWRRRGVAGWKLRSHGRERSNRGAEGKVERFPHGGSVLTSTHQPERLVCSPTRMGGGWGLGAEAQASEVRSQGEDWGWRREHSLKGASAPQLAGREARRRAALTSPRGLSAHPPGRAGAGSWGSGFGASREGVREKVCSCQRGKRLFLAALFCGAQGEGIQSAA